MPLSDDARTRLGIATTDFTVGEEIADAIDATRTNDEADAAIDDLTADLDAVSDALDDHIADAAGAHEASAVSVADADDLLTATDVEGALAEAMKYVPIELADPGTGEAIPVTRSASIAIVTAAAETNTLAIPTFLGQKLILFCDTRAVGDRVVTVASDIDASGNNVMTFGAAGDTIVLEAITVAGTLAWRVTANEGVALS